MSNKRLNAIITIGGAVAASLKGAIGTTTKGFDQIGAAVRRLKKEQDGLSNSINTFGRLGKDVDGMRARYAAVTAELNKQRGAFERLSLAQAGAAAGKSKMASAGLAIGAVAATAATAFSPIVMAAKFEKAMLGVAKQVNGARDSAGQLTPVYYEMARAIQKLGRELPIPTNEIADMVTAAARMGIAKDDLLEFTRTAAMMSVAFDKPAAELADNMGKIAGIFKIPMKEIADLGDAINYLDDNSISKSEIINVLHGDLAGAASTMGLSAKNAAALASTFLTLGESAERADTAASGMLRQLQIAKMNPKKFQVGAEMIGMTGDKLQRGMIDDTQGTILKVLDKINALPKMKQMEAVTRLFGKDWGGAIAKLAGGVSEYRRQLELANGAASKGSMGREMAAQLQATTTQWVLMKNRLVEVGVNIGSVLLPAVNNLLSVVDPMTTATANWLMENGSLISNIAALTGTLGGIYAATKLVGFGVGAVTFAFNALRVALATNPIGLMLALLSTAALMVYKNWDPIKSFFADLWGGVTAAARASMEWIMSKLDAIGKAWQRAKNIFATGPGGESIVSVDAMGNSGGFDVGASSTPGAPPVPVRSSANSNFKQENTISITQQPGQDGKDLAQELMRELKKAEAVNRRGLNYDSAGGAF